MANYCEHYVEKGTFFSTYRYCNITGEEKEVNKDYYDNYCSNYCNVGSCPKYSNAYGSGSSCFITTVACELLNKADNDPVMNNLRNFRDNILQCNKKYYDTLKEYDVIGPVLARKLANDKDGKKISSVLYDDVLSPISNLITLEEYDVAVEKYYVMTLMLINYYGLKDAYNYIKKNDYEYDNFEPKRAGHGKKSLKV